MGQSQRSLTVPNSTVKHIHCQIFHPPASRRFSLAISDHTAVLHNNTVYIAGGCDSDQVCPEYSPVCYCLTITNKLEAWNVESDQWTQLANMPRGRFRHAAAIVAGKMYLLGGRDENDVMIHEVSLFLFYHVKLKSLGILKMKIVTKICRSMSTTLPPIRGLHCHNLGPMPLPI